MEIVWNREDFTATAEKIGQALGMSTASVIRYSKEGGFPFMSRAGVRPNRYYHKMCLTMLGGVIKYNRENGKYVDPVIKLEPLAKTANPTPNTNQNIARLMLKLEAIDQKLVRIETKIHHIAEGRRLVSTKTTIGDMVKKSLVK